MRDNLAIAEKALNCIYSDSKAVSTEDCETIANIALVEMEKLNDK